MDLITDRAGSNPTLVRDRWWWIAAASPTLLVVAYAAATFVPASGPFGLAVLGTIGYLLWTRPRVGAAATGVLTAFAAAVAVALLGAWALLLVVPLVASVIVGMLLALGVMLVVGRGGVS